MKSLPDLAGKHIEMYHFSHLLRETSTYQLYKGESHLKNEQRLAVYLIYFYAFPLLSTEEQLAFQDRAQELEKQSSFPILSLNKDEEAIPYLIAHQDHLQTQTISHILSFLFKDNLKHPFVPENEENEAPLFTGETEPDTNQVITNTASQSKKVPLRNPLTEKDSSQLAFHLPIADAPSSLQAPKKLSRIRSILSMSGMLLLTGCLIVVGVLIPGTTNLPFSGSGNMKAPIVSSSLSLETATPNNEIIPTLTITPVNTVQNTPASTTTPSASATQASQGNTPVATSTPQAQATNPTIENNPRTTSTSFEDGGSGPWINTNSSSSIISGMGYDGSHALKLTANGSSFAFYYTGVITGNIQGSAYIYIPASSSVSITAYWSAKRTDGNLVTMSSYFSVPKQSWYKVYWTTTEFSATDQSRTQLNFTLSNIGSVHDFYIDAVTLNCVSSC